MAEESFTWCGGQGPHLHLKLTVTELGMQGTCSHPPTYLYLAAHTPNTHLSLEPAWTWLPEQCKYIMLSSTVEKGASSMTAVLGYEEASTPFVYTWIHILLLRQNQLILPQGSVAFQFHGNPSWEHSWGGWDMFHPIHPAGTWGWAAVHLPQPRCIFQVQLYH